MQVKELGGQGSVFRDLEVAIIPHPALGDITIYLRLAWLFSCSGAQVVFFSNALYSARSYFPWLEVVPEANEGLDEVAGRYELVIACFDNYYYQRTWSPHYGLLGNVAFVSAKKITRDSGLNGREVVVGQQCFPGACRAFCLNPNGGKSMVGWVDSYAKEVFGLTPHPMPALFGVPSNAGAKLALIFPTTPHQKKNYWLAGFRWLAKKLQKKGWHVEFVCMPDERKMICAALPGYQVRSFPGIKELIEHMAHASVVISNDSGGGHLASLMGLTTFTITRRHQSFSWRPGFNDRNAVIYPFFRFKWGRGQYIWRPFVPIWRVVNKIDAKQLTSKISG